MAKINIALHDRFRNETTEAILEIFVGLINDINPELFSIKDYPKELPLTVRKNLVQEAIRSAEWSIINSGGDTWTIRGPGVEISRVVYDDMLYHKYFEISSKLQGNKIAAHVMRASLRITDTLNIKRIALHANLDVGGYAWLRKGAWPMGGLEELKETARTRINNSTALHQKFMSVVSRMSESQAKVFVLSPDFREYKPLFLGMDWQGSFNPNDIVTRTAMLNGADAAFEVVVKNKAVTPKIPLTSNEKIANEFTKHQLRSMGFSRLLAMQAEELLEAGRDQMEELILKYASKLTPPVDFTNPETVKLLRTFDREIRAFRELYWDDVNEMLTLSLKQYARAEPVFAAAVIEGAVPAALGLQIPSPGKLAKIIDAKPFEGRVLSEWLARTKNLDVERITSAVKQGIVDGITPTQMARSVFGSQQMRGVDGVVKKAIRDIESVMLTATSQIQNDARQALYDENPDIFEEEYFIATLDIKTTHECAGHDGKTYKRGEGPMPPLHFRCRSLRAPYITAAVFRNRGFDSRTESMLLKEFTEKNGIPLVKKRADLTKGFKTRFDVYSRERGRELVGQVPASVNYNKWLKTQTPEFQNEYLGKARAAAFRRGDFELSDLTSPTGRTYTVEELGITG